MTDTDLIAHADAAMEATGADSVIARAHLVPALRDALAAALARVEAAECHAEALEADNAELKTGVVAFCGIHAARYAQDFGLPDGHLHPIHYDILEQAGARMDDFTRAAFTDASAEGGEG